MVGIKVKILIKVMWVVDFWYVNNQVVLLLGGQKKLVVIMQMIKQLLWFKMIDFGISRVIVLFVGDDFQIEELLKVKLDVVIVVDIVQVKQVWKVKILIINVMYQIFVGLW